MADLTMIREQAKQAKAQLEALQAQLRQARQELKEQKIAQGLIRLENREQRQMRTVVLKVTRTLRRGMPTEDAFKALQPTIALLAQQYKVTF